jgi:hypothetical protein
MIGKTVLMDFIRSLMHSQRLQLSRQLPFSDLNAINTSFLEQSSAAEDAF